MGTLHLKILGMGDPAILGNPNLIRRFITNLIQKVGMQPLGEPTIHEVTEDVRKLGREPFEDEGGVTGQIVGYHTLSTSHLSIHTWPIREEFHLDLYSCREFDRQAVVSFIKEALCCGVIQDEDLTKYCKWELPPGQWIA